MAKIFDHRLTTTVQAHYKTLKKPVVMTDNRFFLVWEQLGRIDKIHVPTSCHTALS